MYRLRAADRLRYFFERQFIKGAGYQLLVVAGAIGVVSLIGGLLILPTGEERLGEAVWWAFLRLTDPGYLGDDAGSWRRVVSTGLTVSGYVLFMGTLIAILTQWLTRTMRALEQGLTPITARRHIVVLGFGSRTLPVVAEILNAGGRLRRFLRRVGARRLRIAVLSERVDAGVAQRFRQLGLRGRHSRELVLRSGDPLQTVDLHRVNVPQAAVIILPGGVFARSVQQSEDVATIKTLMALGEEARALSSAARPLVVAELQDRRQREVARAAYPGPLALVAVDQIVNRMVVQQLRHPGIARVFAALLTRSGSHRFHVREAEELAGQRFDALQARFPHALVCGIARPSTEGFEARLNPPGDTCVLAGDRLVFIAAHHDATEPEEAVEEAPPQSAATPPTTPAPAAVAARRLLILGWNQRHLALLEELAGREDMTVALTVVSQYSAEARDRLCAPFLPEDGRVQCTHVEADLVVEHELAACHPERFDAVFIATSELISDEQEADARAIVAKLVLRRLLAEAPRPPRVLLELADSDNTPLMGADREDLLVPPLIVSHLLGQGALRQELLPVFDALLQRDGADLVLLPRAECGAAAEGATCAMLRVMLRERGLLLGWMTADGSITLRPPAEAVPPPASDLQLLLLSPGMGFAPEAR
ncbi:CASTOR/POLLUX-related putative ion channel [Algiphilus aromaticivorans]|jgi:hypothetical protein|uniref:CASTOR/POLLUX-related putative ion channel n=1 Tax=Algiphilus aromaticivorans TaxID=382454 RepID=UPI000694A7B9|nr:hypothetical protein [Algiphilus aromaticivorans]